MKKLSVLLSLCLLFSCAFAFSACAEAHPEDDGAQVQPVPDPDPEPDTDPEPDPDPEPDTDPDPEPDPEPEEPSYSETFEGIVSEQTYASEETAVRAFLETEIAGKAAEVNFIGYEKQETLTEQQVGALAIGDELREGLLSVVRCSVEYTETLPGVGVESVARQSKQAEMYLLSYIEMFRFFVPQTQTGGQISSSYFASTFRAEDYVNCTMDVVQTQTRAGITYVATVIAKATQNALYEYDVYTVDGEFSEEAELFLVDSVEGICSIRRRNNSAWSMQIEGFSADYTINDYFMEWFHARFGELDHSYFIKTETGYAIDAGKYSAYLQTLPEYQGGEFDLEYTINVKDGRMADVTMEIASEGDVSRMTIAFSDFGTTVIEFPDEVTALIPE